MNETQTDITTSLETLKNKMRSFTDARDWNKFQSPKNISMALAIEAAELMEFFMWTETEESKEVLEKRRKDIENEVADITCYLVSFCSHYNIDITQAFLAKMKLNEAKYPLEKAKGTWAKYSDL